jgi:formylglycine-generating enzyme required for sulfatase activity
MIAIGAIVTPILFDSLDQSPSEATSILVPAGRYPTPEGGLARHEAFRIDATEVTIGDYGEFLKEWGRLSQQQRAELLPKSMLDGSWDMRPANWNEYYPLARAEMIWKGSQLTLDHPVIGVDWWDATAYAIWKGGRLPTRQEWWAAASRLIRDTEEKNQWRPVGGSGQGPHQLASNVAEWARGRSRNPAEPTKPPRFSVLGASYTHKKDSAFVQEWVDSPGIARHDLGFRVVYDKTY